MKKSDIRRAYTLVELLAIAAILGLLVGVVTPRVFTSRDVVNAGACHVYQGEIEMQAELWLHNTGALPSSDLTDIGGDVYYFPEGVPVCPVDGVAYTIDSQTGLIIGHVH